MGLGTFLAILVPSIAVTQTAPQASPKFYCFPDPTGNHSTQVSIPGRKPLELISWKKTANPRATCDRISRRFQDFYEAGKLNYIKSGKSDKTGVDIICGTAEDIECKNERDKLFDLPFYNKAVNFLADDLKNRLMDGSGKPIYQGSDDEFTINFQEMLAELRSSKK